MILSGELARRLTPGSVRARREAADEHHSAAGGDPPPQQRGPIELDNHKDARVSTISAPEARQLFEVRLALDPAAVELAAERRTDDDIALMRATVATLLRSPGNGAKTRSPRTATSTAPSIWPHTTTC